MAGGPGLDFETGGLIEQKSKRGSFDSLRPLRMTAIFDESMCLSEGYGL
jgi:hypothetical protein